VVEVAGSGTADRPDAAWQDPGRVDRETD
jgi:hypothetical protein